MAIIATVLKSGGEFQPKHVSAIADSVGQVVCFTDMTVDDSRVTTIPLIHGWKGWWSKMELFRPDIDEDLFYLDLDTLIFGDVQPIIAASRGKMTMLEDFYWAGKPASGVMYIPQSIKDHVWQSWTKNPTLNMAAKPGKGTIGDQGFLGLVLKPNFWQRIAPGKIVSYKVHCKTGRPTGADIVCFHGKPRPWDLSPADREKLC